MKSEPHMSKQARYLAARRATLISVAVNVTLSTGKIIAGLVGNSAAMLADGLHSASDLASDGVVLVSMRIARREADADHPYGHGKFETLATLFIAVALLGVAIGIIIDAVGCLREPDLTPPTTIALVAAIVSILSKEALYRYTIWVGRRLDANALIANAWHQRSDAISSIAALIGISGAMLGWPIMDPVSAIVVAFILGKVGVEFLRDALRELTDSASAVDQEIHDRMTNIVATIPEVRSSHSLRARRLGPDILVDVHVVVNPSLSISEGHQIADKVRQYMMNEMGSIKEVLVHVDTDDDD